MEKFAPSPVLHLIYLLNFNIFVVLKVMNRQVDKYHKLSTKIPATACDSVLSSEQGQGSWS